MTGPRPITDPDRQVAHGRLMRTLENLRASERRVPCMDLSAAWAWTTEDHDAANDKAAALCLGCAGLRDCAAYVDAHPEPASVWAGTTPKERRKAERERKTHREP